VITNSNGLAGLGSNGVTNPSGSSTVILGDAAIFDPNYNPTTASPTYGGFQSVFGLKYGISGPEFDAAYRMGCEVLGKACAGAVDPDVAAWMNTRYTVAFGEIHAIAGKRAAFNTAPLTPFGYPVAIEATLRPYLDAIPASVLDKGKGSPEYRGAVAAVLLTAVNDLLAKPKSAWTGADWGLMNYVDEYVRREELTTARQVAGDYEAWRDKQFASARGAGMTTLYDYGPNPKDQDFYARATVGVPNGSIQTPAELAKIYSGVGATGSAIGGAVGAGASAVGGAGTGAVVGALVLVGDIIPFASTVAEAVTSAGIAAAEAAAGAATGVASGIAGTATAGVTAVAGIVFSLVLADIIKIQETNDAVYGTIEKRTTDGKPLSELVNQTNGQQLLLMHLINMTSGVSYR
jgi:hypothetical protein